MNPQEKKDRYSQPSEGKEYIPPMLIEYGTIQDLTKGGGGPFDDGLMAFQLSEV